MHGRYGARRCKTLRRRFAPLHLSSVVCGLPAYYLRCDGCALFRLCRCECLCVVVEERDGEASEATTTAGRGDGADCADADAGADERDAALPTLRYGAAVLQRFCSGCAAAQQRSSSGPAAFSSASSPASSWAMSVCAGPLDRHTGRRPPPPPPVESTRASALKRRACGRAGHSSGAVPVPQPGSAVHSVKRRSVGWSCRRRLRPPPACHPSLHGRRGGTKAGRQAWP